MQGVLTVITKQHSQEGLSRADVQAVAARAGVNLGTPQLDYGVDGTFRKVQGINGRYSDLGVALDFQLKASVNWQLHSDSVVYDLEAKAYNDLVNQKRVVPLLLIVLCLPQTSADWLEQDEDRLLLRKCCYWFSVEGEPTANLSSERIRIPRSQLLTPDSLTRLLESVERGDFYGKHKSK